jgi:hypothetical protein
MLASYVVRGLAACAAAVLLGCGGDDDGTNDASHPGGSRSDAGPSAASTGGTFTAVIDGAAWQATPMSVRSRVDDDVPGGYQLEGTSASLQQVWLKLYYVDAPGTYDLGVSGSVVGASAGYTRSTSIWQTPATGVAGTLEISALTAHRIAGTFEFVAAPVPGSQAKGMVTITDGQFDLPLERKAAEIGPALGRTLSADFDGERFNAAAIVVTPYAGGVSFNALNDDYNVGFILGEVDGPGTYELSFEPPARTVVVVAGSKGDQAEHCCWGTDASSTGSVTFTTFDDDRLVGTFDLDLAPRATSAASAPLVVMSGEFDIGRQDP